MRAPRSQLRLWQITLVLDLPDVSHEPRELVSVRIVPRDDDDAAAAEDQPKWRTARLRRPRLHASVTITEEMLQVYEKVVWRGTLTRGTNGEVVPVVAKAVDADEFDELRREVDAYDRLRSSGLVGDVAPHLLGVFATRRRVGWAALLMTDEGDALPDRGMGWTKDVDISEAESSVVEVGRTESSPELTGPSQRAARAQDQGAPQGRPRPRQPGPAQRGPLADDWRPDHRRLWQLGPPRLRRGRVRRGAEPRALAEEDRVQSPGT